MRLLSSCWYWAGIHGSSGYGSLWDGEKLKRAHRVVYEALVGEIPEGLVLDHLCKNKICVNPEHLEAVTQGENMRRHDYTTNNNYRLRQTHCKNGHPFGDRTRTHRGRVERLCVICKSEQDRKYKLRRKIIK